MSLHLHHSDHVERETLFADIMLPVPVPRYYTYRVPFEWNETANIGSRVIVQFGPKKILTGIIVTIHDQPPSAYEAKYLLELLDEAPVISPQQLALFSWMSEYYMCAEGQVLQVALPSGLKLSSQSKVQLNPAFLEEELVYPLGDEEREIVSLLQHQEAVDYGDIQEGLGIKGVHKWIKSLLQKNAVLLFEEVKEKYRPKKEKRIRLLQPYCNKAALEALFETLQKKTKQTDILLRYLQLVGVLADAHNNETGCSKSQLLTQEMSPSSLKTLLKNQVFEEFEIIVSRFDRKSDPTAAPLILSKAQDLARDRILEEFKSMDCVLLHGITGSGKTEIYIDLIQQVLGSGSQVLYLLPEIALTTQIVSRLQKVFGAAMGVYHSRFSDNERVEVWQGVLQGQFNLVVGVRSSVMLPFDNLGLIIVDEEHETSYKQFDPAPRYHARDVALVLAKLHHAKTLLGSATPSMESYFHAKSGKYGHVELKERYGAAALPEYKVVDTSAAYEKKEMQGVFSRPLIEALQQALKLKQQAIIFQNRRGYAPYQQCLTCGNIPQCPNCSVSLTYHMHYNQMRCHYCGYKEKLAAACVQCSSTDVDLKGFGTEKLEEDIKEMFPLARIQRMDLDTTRRKYSYQQIIDQFESGKIDILIGTQMVTKGLDFDQVDLVGVLDVDRIIHYPDFRSFERAFQLITQVGGRAGRKSGEGQVIIQTKSPKHELLKLITQHDYQTFHQLEIAERERFRYPPFVRFIRLVVKSNDRETSANSARALADVLIKGLGRSRVLGPQEPLISKIRNQFLIELYVKLEKNPQAVKQVKARILQEIGALTRGKKFKGIRVIPDVDPY